eukprot:1160717-Pelagomonas_calceolata.AAC.13
MLQLTGQTSNCTDFGARNRPERQPGAGCCAQGMRTGTMVAVGSASSTCPCTAATVTAVQCVQGRQLTYKGYKARGYKGLAYSPRLRLSGWRIVQGRRLPRIKAAI